MIREAPKARRRGKGVEVGKERFQIQLHVPKKKKKRHESARDDADGDKFFFLIGTLMETSGSHL